jgi:hypothetical protein
MSAGPAPAAAGEETRANQLGGKVNVLATPQPEPLQVIRAELICGDACSAQGLTARGSAPVLKLCRALLAAGHDPDRPLHAYRNNTLALRVTSIGQAARLTVKSAGNGAPKLALDSHWRGAAAPLIAPAAKSRPATRSSRHQRTSAVAPTSLALIPETVP